MTSLQRKICSVALLSFALFSFTLCFTAGPLVFAAIVHTPFEAVVPFPYIGLPSNPVEIDPLEIDFNGDETPEFFVQTSIFDVCVCLPGDPQPPFMVSGVSPGEGATNQGYVVTSTSSDQRNPAALDQGYLIGPGTAGLSGSQTLLKTYSLNIIDFAHTGVGNFVEATQLQYLGVQFDLNDTPHYGWVGIRASPNASPVLDAGHLAIRDFAYEDTGAPILAGQITDLLIADNDSDGDVDGNDFFNWQRNDASAAGIAAWTAQFGESALANATTAIPEPSTLLLTIVVIGTLGAARNHKI